MSDAIVKCGNCGVPLDVRYLPPDGLAKCARCGATTDVGVARQPYEFPFLGLASLATAIVSFPVPFVFINPLAWWLGPLRGSVILALIAFGLAAWSLVRRGNWLAWSGVLVGAGTILYCVLISLYFHSAM